MKKALLFFGFATLMNSGVCLAQQKLPALTPADRKSYILAIDAHKMSKSNDMVTFPVVLTNNTNDTLKYFTMSCSYEEVFMIDNPIMNIFGKGCDKNIPIIVTIPPHKFYSVNITVLLKKKSTSTNDKFRIGMYLLRYSHSDYIFLDPQDLINSLTNQGNYLIWSNEVTMP